MKKISSITLLVTVVAALFLATGFSASPSRFPIATINNDPPVEGGTLRIGIPGFGGGFYGQFNPVFQLNADDGHVVQLLTPPLLSINAANRFSNNGAAGFEYDLDAMTFTIKLVEKIFWHDGIPLTLDDLLFAYEVIAHPLYTGALFHSHSISSIDGAWDYFLGSASTISGIILSEDKMTMTIYFTEMSPAMLYSGIWTTPLPRHHFEGIAVEDIYNHPNSRHNMLGYGPFMLDFMIPGEMVSFVRNENFWLGVPYLERIEMHSIFPEIIPEAMTAGFVDVMLNVPIETLIDMPNPSNFSYLATFANTLGFTHFRHGFGRPVDDVNLRRAMGYAINEARIIEQVFPAGNQLPATSAMTPFQNGFWRSDMVGFSLFDPVLANQILDDVGYTKRDEDGFRMAPDGQILTLTWAVHWNTVNEVIVPLMIEDFANIGIRVELWQDELIDFGAFIQILEDNWYDESFDLFDLAFLLSVNPDPSGIWAPDAPFNFSRYASPELNEILARLSGSDAFDMDFAVRASFDWQEYFYTNVPAIPRRYALNLTAVNNRVQNFSLERMDGIHEVSFGASHLWRVTSHEAEWAEPEPVRRRIWRSLF